MGARPFPWASLEGLTRAEVEAASRLTRAAVARADRAGAELSALLGVDVRARVRRAGPLRTDALAPGALAVHLGVAGDPRGGLVVAVEPALAAALAARVLGRAPPRVVAHDPTPSPALAGVLAALARAVAARAHRDGAPRVLAAGPAREIVERASAWGAACATTTVVVGDEAYAVLVATLDPPAWGEDGAPLSRDDLARLGPLPLALPVVVASARCVVDDLARLTPGDALLAGVPWPRPDEALAVALTPPRADHGLAARLSPSWQLVLGGERVAMPLVAPDEARGGAEAGSVDALSEVEVVARVELGEVELAASAWARARPGETAPLRQRPREPATLRVAGVEIARGELVSLEGELAVRVTSRAR